MQCFCKACFFTFYTSYVTVHHFPLFCCGLFVIVVSVVGTVAMDVVAVFGTGIIIIYWNVVVVVTVVVVC